jgi:hypothetical protein
MLLPIQNITVVEQVARFLCGAFKAGANESGSKRPFEFITHPQLFAFSRGNISAQEFGPVCGYRNRSDEVLVGLEWSALSKFLYSL